MALSLQTSPDVVPALRAARRYLVLHLPRWATDCLKRADRQLAQSELPLVLWEKQKGAMRLVALDLKASALGLSVGQTLSDARALVPNLDVREIDRTLVDQTFADFADWHSNASPVVSVLTHSAPYGDLCLDITGVSHLFSGEPAMLAQLTDRLSVLGFTVRGAIASSLGAAWALAHYSAGMIIAPGEEEAALAPLPVNALRLSETQLAGLDVLGLKKISQLYGRSRKDLQARFGVSLLLRLDQAFGWVEEKPAPRLPIADYLAERRFAEPIGLMDDVQMCAHDLAVQLGCILEREGLGAHAFHLFLYRVDHKVMTLTVNAARATRDAAHIARLFSYRADRLSGEYDAGFGIDMIRLAASETTDLDIVQIGAFGSDDGAEDLDQLYDRMTSRLGSPAVVRTKVINTHIPEQMASLEPALGPKDDARPPELFTAPRPIRLLPHPEPITAIAEVPDAPPVSMIWRRISYHFIKSSGPERISADWRQSDARLMLTADSVEDAMSLVPLEHYFIEGRTTRDYYMSEDSGGRRFWLFRLGLFAIADQPRWFLHGFFG